MKRATIPKCPTGKLYYLVDANFLANKYIDPNRLHGHLDEKKKVENSKAYWDIIEGQIGNNNAMVYVLDIMVAEVFKVFAKNNYQRAIFKYRADYKRVCDAFRAEIRLPSASAKKTKRVIRYHDIQINRDIIIGVDRFLELMNKSRNYCQLADTLLLSTSKYLMDFYGFTHLNLFIITGDYKLWKLGKLCPDLPYIFNPNNEAASSVFR